MLDNHQTDQSPKGEATPENEIELIDLLRILWKWKYLIIGGTIACFLVAVIISFAMPKIYSIDTIIEPGILSIGNSGDDKNRRVYIDSPQNIKALIDVGSFENHILAYLGKLPVARDFPDKIEFDTSIPKNSNTLKVCYETSNVEQGLRILNYLNYLLLEKYGQLVKYYQNDLNNKIKHSETKLSKISAAILKVKNDVFTAQSSNDSAVQQKKNKIPTIKVRTEAKKNLIENLHVRIKDVELEINRITKNTDFLIEERNKLLASEKKEDNILSSLIYINTIQQNIASTNNLNNETNNVSNRIIQEQADIERLENELLDLDVQIENLIKQTKYKTSTLQSRIKDLENQRKYAEEEIKFLEFKKDSVQNLQILKPPTNGPKPIKPRLLLNAALAFMVGILLMVFLSFFIEYISKNRQFR